MRKLLFLVFLFGGFAAFSQGKVTGTVIDSETNSPLAGANVVETGTTNGNRCKAKTSNITLKSPCHNLIFSDISCIFTL